jgi:hypothetical protein
MPMSDLARRLDHLESQMTEADCVCGAPQHQIGLVCVNGLHGLWLKPGQQPPKNTDYFDCPVHGRKRCPSVVELAPPYYLL